MGLDFSCKSPYEARRKIWVLAHVPGKLGVMSHACTPILEKWMHKEQEFKAILETSLGYMSRSLETLIYLGAPGRGSMSPGTL